MFSRLKNTITANLPHFSVEVREDYDYVITDKKNNWIHIVHRTNNSGRIATFSEGDTDGCNTKKAEYSLTLYSLFDCYDALDFGTYLSNLIDKVPNIKISALYTNPTKILAGFEGIKLRKKVKIIKIDFFCAVDINNCFNPCENLEKTSVLKLKKAK